jgi:hypothetical protein
MWGIRVISNSAGRSGLGCPAAGAETLAARAAAVGSHAEQARHHVQNVRRVRKTGIVPTASRAGWLLKRLILVKILVLFAVVTAGMFEL